ncbi:Os02g0757400 [Oryza sativa Japonica Group]|uniref:Os02g0757400 protein n=2 Tax=Oryza sativa subsp. japonica TaxID=39947 RepID=A0A0N7KG46_ORYSJ|nr:Os02g0757400 [Oryza sativa Japonica Group]
MVRNEAWWRRRMAMAATTMAASDLVDQHSVRRRRLAGVHSIRQSPSRVAQLMKRRVGGGGLVMPSAGLQSFTYIALLPVYDHMVVPLARRLAGGGRDGITMLQHVGAGMATACLTTVVAALVEARRLRVACDTGLVDRPDATVPMDVWWLVPQHVLVGVTEVLAVIELE